MESLDRNQAVKLIDQLEHEGDVLEINFKREVRISHKRNGKKTFDFIGIIEDFKEQIVPLFNKPWISAFGKGIKSFHKFGDSLPKRDNRNKEIRKKVERWFMAFEALKALGIKSRLSKWDDSYLKVTYDVEEFIFDNNILKVYFFNKIPRFVEFDGEKLAIPQLKPDLKTQIFKDIKEVK